MRNSIFKKLKINNPQNAFNNAIKSGMKNAEEWMYMYSDENKDYFKNITTRRYEWYFN